MEVSNRFIVMKKHIEDAPKASDLELRTEDLTLSVQPGSDEIMVKNLYISIDPYQMNRMKRQSCSHNTIGFAVPITPGQVIS